MNELTWTCHICGKERPDSLIGVVTTDVSAKYDLLEGMVEQNVRFCVDDPDCAEKALDFTFL